MELTLKELKPILKYIIKNNDALEERGITPVAVNIVSEAGVGKSSVIEEIAKELDANYIKLVLSQITETGDISGFPLCLHYACKEDGSDCKWLAPELIDSYVKAGYQLTGETKMSYALPEWYKNIDPSKRVIINLDDSLRALPNILQAVYELIYKQEFWSFKLPPHTTIFLTNNPSDGNYNVNEDDEAGKTRKINFNIRWDIDSWAEWAERNEMDNRTINFLLSYHNELMQDKGDHKHIMNARSYTMFANVISGIPNWSNPDNLAMILQIASGCFDDPDNIIGSLFTTFIANKLDRLISPKDILLKDWKDVYKELKSSVYDDNKQYRPAIAAIISTRLLNYIDYYFTQKGSSMQVVIDRLLEFLHTEEKIFDNDIIYNIIKNLGTKYSAKMNKYYYNPEIRKYILD